MNSIADGSVIIHTSSESVPCPPPWFGELVLLTVHLRKLGILSKLSEELHLRRRRFGHYELIDFLAVLFGYAGSFERTLQAFYEAVQPVAQPFMALFGRERLPAHSTLSRALAALTKPVVEALRTLFLADLLARPLCIAAQEAGLWDRQARQWTMFDIDGTREAARQRALPKGKGLPEPERRLAELCAKGYTGRKRGEVVRTRTVVSQAHSYQWLGTFGNPGNGHYREELRRAIAAITSYVEAHALHKEGVLLRLDGQYGTAAVLADLAGFSFVVRGQDYHLLERESIQMRLHLPADATFSRPENTLVRSLYDCPDVLVGPAGVCCRVVVATHPAPQKRKKRHIGHIREGLVYELFLTTLPQNRFTAADVVALYLHRGAFEPVLSDEDVELDPDRWCSHTPCGQECWQIVCQWLWNLRVELGHALAPEPLRTSEFAPAASQIKAGPSPAQGYEPPVVGGGWKAGRFVGKDFAPQPDGTLRCPADHQLFASERRREADGSLRVVYEARIADCRACLLREQCQWHGKEARHPRRVSLLLHPLQVGPHPLLWRDWPRRLHRRACIQLLRRQRIEVQMPPALQRAAPPPQAPLTRAQRAHYRLADFERLARNACIWRDPPATVTLFGVPEDFAAFLGLKTT